MFLSIDYSFYTVDFVLDNYLIAHSLESCISDASISIHLLMPQEKSCQATDYEC